MAKGEKLKEMLESRKRDIEKQIINFDPKFHLTYTDFDSYVNETQPAITVMGIDFMPARVLGMLDPAGQYRLFKEWADSVDLKTIPSYIQLHDELEEIIGFLEEL